MIHKQNKIDNFATMSEIKGTIRKESETSHVHDSVTNPHLVDNEEIQTAALCDGSILIMRSQQNRMRIGLSTLIRLMVPLCNGFVRGWRGIRSVRLLRSIRSIQVSRQTLTSMLAFAANTLSLSLSSVQVAHRIDPILKIIKLKKNPTAKCDTNGGKPKIVFINQGTKCEPHSAEKSVRLNVLAEPPSGLPIRADIVFIHGLHGSLVNTWKQGVWKSKDRRVKFERPPKPPIRPPKRPRHSRSSMIGTLHLKKRARYCESSDIFYYNSDEEFVPDEQQNKNARNFTYEECRSDSVESSEFKYNFPNFRIGLENQLHSDAFTHFPNALVDCRNHKGDIPSDVDDKFSTCWPRDWLPIDCPGVRVIALNYTTDPYLWRPLWVRKRNRSSLTERAREMTDLLIEHGVGYGHPIVWVGHSKGGIFIKQILVNAWESGRPAAAPLWQSSRGVFFYSVPHRGSPLAGFNLPFLRQSIELMEIQKNCSAILELHQRFLSLYHSGYLKVEVFSFVETALTLMSVLYLRIVGVDSADPGIGQVCGLHLDHREICKPRSRKCILYTSLVRMINKVC